MNFYIFFYKISFIIILITNPVETSSNNELKILNNSFVLIPGSIGLRFVTDVNNTSEFDDFEVNFVPDRCCLDMGDKLECDVVEINGECLEIIPKGTSKKLTLVAPLLNPYNHRGFCTAFLDSKPLNRKRKTMRDNVKIFFDTNLKNYPNLEIPTCDIDEDPFNNCEPVNCDIHYNGKKPFYDTKTKRCTEVPECISKNDENIPRVVYDPRINTCLHENSVGQEDFDFVKDLVHEKNRLTKDIVIVKKKRPHRKNHSENNDSNSDIFDSIEDSTNYPVQTKKGFKDNLLDDETAMYKNHGKKKHKHIDRVVNLDSKIGNDVNRGIFCYLTENKSTLCFLGLVTLIQIALLCGLIYLLSINVFCRCTKRLERQYYNYRQDVSVTTPLIGTSNIETETTCQFMTESSNIDKKIQCYKSCQREQPKVCLSDDILSKCLNRRKWELKQTKSQNINPDFSSFNDKTGFKSGIMQVSEYQQYSVCTNKPSTHKVSYESEKQKKTSKSKSKKSLKSDVNKHDKELREYTDSEVVSSEKMIKCHSFNYMGDDPNKSDGELKYKCGSAQTSIGWEEANDKSKENMTGFKPDRESNVYTCIKDQRSHSIEKAAQASFTNDSLDDFLSERRMNFLPGDDISRFSLESDMVTGSSSSSKTSKNHLIKNVLSLFRRSSKRIFSEPKLKKSRDSINLELIHMSRATVYSSSNVESEIMNLANKKTKDSRTSL